MLQLQLNCMQTHWRKALMMMRSVLLHRSSAAVPSCLLTGTGSGWVKDMAAATAAAAGVGMRAEVRVEVALGKPVAAAAAVAGAEA